MLKNQTITYWEKKENWSNITTKFKHSKIIRQNLLET